MAHLPASSLATPSSQPRSRDVPLVAFERVGKTFGRRTALRGVSFDLRQGACLLVLGPNGSGKTTLLRLAAGLAAPSEGRMLVEGNAARSASRLRPRVGYLGHRTLLYDGLTARQNLVFFARLYGLESPVERASEVLRDVGLEPQADRPVGSLSRGMQQRLAIGRAILHSPSFLVLDEPGTGLDAEGLGMLRRRLAESKRQGAALLLAAHLAEAAPELADQVLVLSGGEARHLGPAPGSSAELVTLYERVTASRPASGEERRGGGVP